MCFYKMIGLSLPHSLSQFQPGGKEILACVSRHSPPLSALLVSLSPSSQTQAKNAASRSLIKRYHGGRQ